MYNYSIMLRLRIPLAAFASILGAVHGQSQTVTWGGGFPNDKFNVATNWVGGVAPLNNARQ